MAKNWMAYEAAEVVLKGTDVEAVTDIMGRFPLFAMAVLRDGTELLVDILKAVPKVTARMVETGMKELAGGEEPQEEDEEIEEEEQEGKKQKKSSKTTEVKQPKSKQVEQDEEEENEEKDYSEMSSKELYALCCKRGLSSKCKKRDKASLIAVLKAGESEADSEEDEWGDEEEEEPKKKDPYAGKTAKELYTMCKERGIKVQPKKEAAEYAKLLKKADEVEEDSEEDSDDDEWEI